MSVQFKPAIASAPLRAALETKLPGAQLRAQVATLKKAGLDAFQTNASYAQHLRSMSPEQLQAEVVKLKQTLADASGGSDKSSSAVARAREKLAECAQEQKTRAGFETSGNPRYAAATHGMSDAQLSNERATQLERYRDATTGPVKDPAVARDAKQKLGICDAERSRRAGDVAQGGLVKEKTGQATKFGPPEQWVYAQGLENKSTPEVQQKLGEAMRELRDATTGPQKSPEAAEAARTKIDLCKRELASRGTKEMTPGAAAKFAVSLQNKSMSQLENMKRHLETKLAIGGDRLDPQAKANLMRQIGIIDGAIASRGRELGAYRREVGNMSSAQLSQALRENSRQPITGIQADKLGILREEAARRRGEPKIELKPGRLDPGLVENPRPMPAPFPGFENARPLPGKIDLRPPPQAAEPAAPAAPAEVEATAPAAPTEASLQQQIDELSQRIQVNIERYTEATTGLHQDPAVAADALKQIGEDLKALSGLLQQQSSAQAESAATSVTTPAGPSAPASETQSA
ncbi:MAG: hypothetical protein JNK82_35610 [Myxococcaceae bacterium]|nr:hypothetical protein [Myxococcaceae bacterium]